MLEAGFIEAESINLPKVDVFMIVEFIKNYNRSASGAPKMKLGKIYRSPDEDYGDDAIGYVCLKEQDSHCTIKAKICPQYLVPIKYYSVKIIINTDTELIEDMSCEDCKESSGGCKHSFALLLWLHRKSEQPEPRESQCFWVQPFMTFEKKYCTIKEMFNLKEDDQEDVPDTSEFFNTVLRTAQEKQIDCPLTRHFCTLKKLETYKLSLHQLIINFIKSGNVDVNKFIEYCKSQYTLELCKKIQHETQQESDSSLWEEMRYARITASLLHEAAHCKSSVESLKETFLGASEEFYITKNVQGQHLDSLVISEIEKQLKKKVKKSGLLLIPEYPVFCAAPNALGEDFVLEVKCPNSLKNIDKYISNGNISDKYKAQIHLQMHAAKMKKGLFCIADTQFERNKVLHLTWINYDPDYMNTLLNKAMNYWKENIFCKISSSVTL